MEPFLSGAPRISPLALFLGFAGLSACRDSIPTTPTVRSVQPPVAQQPYILATDGLTLDDHLASLGQGIPGGFGGLYFDGQGRLNLWLRDTSLSEAAITHLLGLRPAQPGRKEIVRSQIFVRPAQFEFAQLLAWYRTIRQHDRGIRISIGDIDESRNRIMIGVVDASDATAARQLLETLSVPTLAVEVRVVGVNTPDVGLKDHFRPAPAGVQIEARGPDLACTLGVNVIHHQFGQTLVTASHCSALQGSTTGDSVAQHILADGHRIGAEVLDPPYTAGGGCPFAQICRRSDATLYRHADQTAGTPWWPGGTAMQGWIANPAGYSSTTDTILELDPTLPYKFTLKWEWICIIGYPCSEYQGMPVEKIGRTTGKTSGVVTGTCVDFMYTTADGTFTHRCMVTANYFSGGGDSGAAVYVLGGYWGEEDMVRVLGIHSGRNNSTGQRFFARIKHVENELGANPAVECNGFRISWPGSWQC